MLTLILEVKVSLPLQGMFFIWVWGGAFNLGTYLRDRKHKLGLQNLNGLRFSIQIYFPGLQPRGRGKFYLFVGRRVMTVVLELEC